MREEKTSCRHIIYVSGEISYYKHNILGLGFSMKKTDKDKVVDIDFLNLFKKSLALSFSLLVFGVQSSYANNITAGGNFGTDIVGGNTNNTTINGGIINNGTGFHHFDQFQIDANGIANLIFGTGANRYVNMVNNQVLINGIFNAMKDGKIGGNVVFVSPMGMIVGASGVVNVGSLQTLTPMKNAYDSLIGMGNSIQYSDISSIVSNSDRSSTRIDGKIFALNDIDLNDGKKITISPTANIVAGFNQNGFAKTTIPDFDMSQIVNDKGVVDARYMTDGAGKIKIVSYEVASEGIGGLIQSSGSVTIDTPPTGTIDLGAKVYANGNVVIGNKTAESGTRSVYLNNDVTSDGGNISINAIAQVNQGEGTNVTATEKTGDTNTGKIDINSNSLIADGNITADNGISLAPAAKLTQGENSEIKNNKTGEIKIETAGLSTLNKITNLGGNIDITSGEILLKDTVSTERGNISVLTRSDKISQSNDSFNAFETKNGGNLTINSYIESDIGSSDQSINVKIDGNVNINGSNGSAYIKSKDADLKLGDVQNLSNFSAQSEKKLIINQSVKTRGAIDLKANEGISQSSGSVITSSARGEITITNTDLKDADGNVTKASSGAISVGQITNSNGGVTITNEAAGELLNMDKTLSATGDINLNSNAGISQTSSSIIKTTLGDINLTNNITGSMNLNEITTNAGGVNITNKATDGNIVLNKNISGAKNITVSGHNGITQNTGSKITLNGDADQKVTIENTGKGDVTINEITNNNGSISIKNVLTDEVQEADAGNVIINGNVLTNGSFIDILTNGNYTQNGTLTAGGFNAITNHSININADKNAILGEMTGKNDILINADDVLIKKLITSDEGSIEIISEKNIKQDGTGKKLHAGNKINLTATTGSIGETDNHISLNASDKVGLKGDNIYVTSPDADVKFGTVTGKNEVSLNTTNTSGPPIPGGKITFTDNVTGSKINIDSAKNIQIDSNLTAQNGLTIKSKTGMAQGTGSTITNSADGNIDITNTDSGKVSLNKLNAKKGNINIANNGGGIDLNGLITNQEGNVYLSAKNDIFQNLMLGLGLDVKGDISLTSTEGKIGTSDKFISFTTPGTVFASATNTDNGSVYLRSVGSDLTFDAAKILFGKDVGLASDRKVILNNDLNALNGSIYIDSGQMFNLAHSLNALNNIEITATGGINQQATSNITTTGDGRVSMRNLTNGSIDVNNINSSGNVRIINENGETDTNGKVNINGNITAQKTIDITANNGITQKTSSTITSEGLGDINIVNNVKNDVSLNKIDNKNGNINVENKAKTNILINDVISAKDGNIKINNAGAIVQNSTNGLLTTNKNITLSSTNESVGADTTGKYIKVKADGTVSGSAAKGFFAESNNYDLKTGSINAGQLIKLQTIGSGSIISRGRVSAPVVALTAADSILDENGGNISAYTSTGGLTLTALNGSIGTLAQSFNISSGGTITATASKGDIFLNGIDRNSSFGNITSGGKIGLSSSGTLGQIILNNAVTSKDTIDIDSISDVLIKNNLTAANDISVNAKTGITQTGASITSSVGNININNTNSGNVTLKDVTTQSGNININTETSTGNTILGGLLKASGTTDKGKINIKSGGDLTQSHAGVSLNAENAIDISSKNGSIGNSTTDNIKLNTQGTVTATAKSNIYIESPNTDLKLGKIQAGQTIDLKTTGTAGNVITTDTISGSNIILNTIKELIVQSNITSSGAISLNAKTGVTQNSGTILSTGVGDIAINNATSGDISLKTVSNQNGQISIANKALNQDVILNDIINAANGNISIEADRNIAQASNTNASIVGTNDVSLIAKKGDVGFGKVLKINTDGKVNAQGQNVYLDSPDKDLNLGDITAVDKVILSTSGMHGNVKFYGLTKAAHIEVNSLDSILQDPDILKALDSSGEIRLTAASGSVGESGNSIDLSARTNVLASAINSGVYINGVDSNLNTALITAKTNIDLSTSGNGKIIVTDDLTTTNGYIKLDSAKDLDIQKNISASSDVTLKAQEGISHTAGTIKSTGNGKVSITNEKTGNVSIKDVTSNGGNIAIENKAANGDVILNTLVETNNGGSITVKSNRNITQTTDNASLKTDGDIFFETTAGNVGLLDKFLKVFTSGKVHANSGDSIFIESSDIDLKTGTVTAQNNVNLKTTNDKKLIVVDTVTANNGNVNLTSATDIELDGLVKTNTGDIILKAENNIIQTKLSGAALDSARDIDLTTVTGNIGGAKAIDVTAKGKIKADAAQAVKLNGYNSDLKTDLIKAGTNIDLSTTGVGNLIVSNDMRTDNGYIKLNSANNLELSKNITASEDVTLIAKSGINQTDGTIQSSGTGNILVRNTDSNDIAIKNVLGNGGNINVENIATGGNVSLNGLLTTSTAGNITVLANNNITQGLGVTGGSLDSVGNIILKSTNGSIGERGNSIDIAVDGSLEAWAENGGIAINSINKDINTDSIHAGTNIDLSTEGSGNIIISSDLITTNGYIRLNSAEDLRLNNNITASDDVILSAQNGIEQQSGEIKSTGTGYVSVTNESTGDISLKNVSTNSGNITVENKSTNAAGGNVIFTGLVESKNGGNLSVTAEKNITQTTNGVALKTDGTIALNAKDGNIQSSLADKFFKLFSGNGVSAKGNNIYLETPDNDLTTGDITAKNELELKTTGTKGSVITNGNIAAKDISINAIDNINVNKNINAQTSLDLNAQKGLSQKQGSTISTESGNFNITANNGNLDLKGKVANTTGRVNITNKSTGNATLNVHDLTAGDGFTVIHKGNGILSLDGTIDNDGVSTITAENNGANSGIVTSGTINNKNDLKIENKGQKGIKLGGTINNNLIDETGGAHSDVTVHNQNGAFDVSAKIINGTNKLSQNQINLTNDGAGGFNFAEDGIIDNHGLLTVTNNAGNMSLWGTLKARLKSTNRFINNGVVGSADDDVIVGLKLENWGNEITYENTGAGSLIIHEKAVLSNFSVQDDEGVHTGILNLRNSGHAGQAGGGIQIDGTINNGIISDGTIVGNDNNLIAAGEIVSGGIVNIENDGTGVAGTDSASQRQGDFGIEINNSAKINNFAEMNIVNKNTGSTGKIKIDGTITGDKGTILGAGSTGAPIPAGNFINITNNAQGANSGIEFSSTANVDVKGNVLNITNEGGAGINFGAGSSVKNTDNMTIANNNTESGITFGDNAKASSGKNLILTNQGKNGIILGNGSALNAGNNLTVTNFGNGGITGGNNVALSSGGNLVVLNDNVNTSGIIFGTGSSIISQGLLDITNQGQNGISFDTATLDSTGKLTVTNNGGGGINFNNASKITSKDLLDIINLGNGGIGFGSGAKITSIDNLTISNNNTESGINFGNGATVSGKNINVTNEGKDGITSGNNASFASDGDTRILNNNTENSGISFGTGSALTTKGIIEIKNKGTKGITAGNNVAINSDSNMTISNENTGASGIIFGMGSTLISKGLLDITNQGQNGISFDTATLDATGKLTVTNNGGGIDFQNASKITAKDLLDIINIGEGGINFGSGAKISALDNLTITHNNAESGINFGNGATVSGKNLNVTNEGKEGITVGNNASFTSEGGMNILNNNSGNSGISLGTGSSLASKGLLNLQNNGINGITTGSNVALSSDGNMTIANNNTSASGIILGTGSNLNSKGTLDIKNQGQNGISFDNTTLDSTGKLSVTNNGGGGIDFKNGTTVTTQNNLDITNHGQNGIKFHKNSKIKAAEQLNITNTGVSGVNVDGNVQGKNITVTNSNSNLNIAHNSTNGNLTAENNIVINQTNGNVLNQSSDGSTIADGVGIKAGGNINLNVTNGNVGIMDGTLNNIINGGFNLDPNNSIHISAGGKVNATANDLNLKSMNTDLNIGQINAKNALINTLNGSINALDGSSVNTTNNMYLFAEGNASQITANNLTVGGKLYTESDADTTIKSQSGLDIDSMLSKNGSINIETGGNTKINEIAAQNDISVKVNDEKLTIVNLGRVERDKNIIPKTVHLTVNDAKKAGTGTANGKLDILNGYVRDKVTLKADTINAGVYDLESDIAGTTRPGASGFHNANLNGKLLEFDVQGANYAQGDVSGISRNEFYEYDPNDKHALNVYITIGDSVGDAKFGANFKKLYSNNAFVDSINVADSTAISHLILESGIIGEKAIFRNNNLRLDIDNENVAPDYPINKHYNDSPNETVKKGGSFAMEMNDTIIIDKDPVIPIPPTPIGIEYNPHRLTPEYDLDEEITPLKAKGTDNRAVKSENSTAYKQIRWMVKNKDNEIIGASVEIDEPIIKSILNVSKDGIIVSANKQLKKDEMVHINMSYKDVPFSVDGKVKNNKNGISEITFANADNLTSTILLFVSMYQENL